jgi:hypothetical protein
VVGWDKGLVRPFRGGKRLPLTGGADQFLGDQLLSPAHNRSLLDHPPGTSLPPGLAAGMSRLHLKPAAYTGETPPSSFGITNTMPIRQRDGMSPRSSPWSPALPPLDSNPRSSALGRRLSSGANGHHVGSPLSQTWLGGEHEEPSPLAWQQPPHPGTPSTRKSALADLVHEDEDLPFSMDV